MAQSNLVNMIPNGTLPRYNVSQYDVGRELAFILSDGSGAYSIPSGATIKIQGTKPSGMGFSVTGTYSGNTVTIVTTAEMTDENGNIECELSVSSGSVLLGTTNIVLAVEKSPHPDGTIDGQAEQLLPTLTVLVNRIESAAESVHDLTVTASTLPQGSEATATYDGTNNSIAFGIPRGSSINCTDSDGDITITFI